MKLLEFIYHITAKCCVAALLSYNSSNINTKSTYCSVQVQHAHLQVKKETQQQQPHHSKEQHPQQQYH
jgi:hypothetical protein